MDNQLKEKIAQIIRESHQENDWANGDYSDDDAEIIYQLFDEEKRELFRFIEDEEPNAFARLYPKLSRFLKGEK